MVLHEYLPENVFGILRGAYLLYKVNNQMMTFCLETRLHRIRRDEP
jgi:hypothetical protein